MNHRIEGVNAGYISRHVAMPEIAREGHPALPQAARHHQTGSTIGSCQEARHRVRTGVKAVDERTAPEGEIVRPSDLAEGGLDWRVSINNCVRHWSDAGAKGVKKD